MSVEKKSRGCNSSHVMGRRGRILSCVFLPDVSCSFRKSKKSTVMNRCWNCAHYRRFMREMEEEEAKEDAEMEDILKNPEKYGYSRG